MAGKSPCRDFYIFFSFFFSLAAKLIGPLPGCEFVKNNFFLVYTSLALI